MSTWISAIISRVIVEQRFYAKWIRPDGVLGRSIAITATVSAIGAVTPIDGTILRLIIVGVLADHIDLNVIVLQIRFAGYPVLRQIFGLQRFNVNGDAFGA